MVPEVTVREVKPEEEKCIQRIASRLYDQMRHLKSKPGASYANFDCITRSLETLASQGNLLAFYTKEGDHMVGCLGFTIGQPWYTSRTILEEVFVLQIDKNFHGFGRVALREMKRRAGEYGCALMETGASMTDQPELLANLYEKKGRSTFSYPSFVWVFPNN